MCRKMLFPIVICSIIFLAVFPAIFGPYWTNAIFGEWGPIETTSAIMWFLAAAIAVTNCNITVKMRALFGSAFVLFALRELDFQKRFTDTTFIKSNYYDDIGGLSHYLLGALAIVLIAIIAAAAIISALNLRRDLLPAI